MISFVTYPGLNLFSIAVVLFSQKKTETNRRISPVILVNIGYLVVAVNVPSCLRHLPCCLNTTNIKETYDISLLYTYCKRIEEKHRNVFFLYFFFIFQPFFSSFGPLLAVHLSIFGIPFVFRLLSSPSRAYMKMRVCFSVWLVFIELEGPSKTKEERIVHLYIPRSLRWPYTHSIYI